MKRILIFMCILLISGMASADTYTVDYVIDCETLMLKNGKKARLIGVDCPEVKINSKARKESKKKNRPRH